MPAESGSRSQEQGSLMSAGFKVKISDGSVVGPLDPEMVQSWFEQGLIDRDTPVLAPSARQWKRLKDVVDLGDTKHAASDDDHEVDDGRPSRAARIVAGGLMILSAAGAVLGLLAPTAWRSDLTPMPWLEIGLILLFVGLICLHESEWTRKLARACVGMAAFALFPVAGIVIAKGVPLDGLAVLACAWLAASGLFFMLSPVLSRGRLVAALLVVLLGAYGVFRFGVVVGAGGVVAALGTTLAK
jgi:hypothetical protein